MWLRGKWKVQLCLGRDHQCLEQVLEIESLVRWGRASSYYRQTYRL